MKTLMDKFTPFSPQYRSESAEIKALADKIIATAEKHHRIKTTIPKDSFRQALPEWNKDSIHSHNQTFEHLKRIVQRTALDRDLDALRAYDKFDTEGHSYKLSNLQRVIQDLRYAGHQETCNLITQAMLDRAAKMWIDLFDEDLDHKTSLYGERITNEDRAPYLRPLRLSCLIAPDDVAEYIISDTQRAMNIVGDRLISDHEEFFRLVKVFIDSETPVLSEGML
jgi:hypothetical protein